MQEIRQGLAAWLNFAFGASFKDLGDTLPIGQQYDDYSCGICVANAMEHAMFNNTLLFDYKNPRTLRIRYFIETVKYLIENVRTLSSPEATFSTYLDFSSLRNPWVATLSNTQTHRAQKPRRWGLQ